MSVRMSVLATSIQLLPKQLNKARKGNKGIWVRKKELKLLLACRSHYSLRRNPNESLKKKVIELISEISKVADIRSTYKNEL